MKTFNKQFWNTIIGNNEFNKFGKISLIIFLIPFTLMSILLLICFSPLLLCVNVWGVKREDSPPWYWSGDATLN